MPRFVARPVVIEAHQWMGGAKTALPESFRRAVTRHLPNHAVEIMTGDGACACPFRGYIYRGPDGQYSVLKEAAFEAFFTEHVPDTAEAAGKRAQRKELV